jgi:hypothetical protein
MSKIEEYKKLLDEDDVEDQQLKTPLVEGTTPPAPRSRGGCPCWCKCIAITLAAFGVFTTLAGVASYYWMANVVERLTVTTPHAAFPVVAMPEAELEAVKLRVELFVDRIMKKQDTEPLEITQDELNGFVAHSDFLRGNMLVTLKEGALKEEFSLSTQFLPGGYGRFFVGTEEWKLEGDKVSVDVEAQGHEEWFDGPLLVAQLQYLVTNKEAGEKLLELYLTKGSFFGQEAPQEYIDQRLNLLQDLYKDSDSEDAKAARELINGIDRVTIQEGKIIVTARTI